MILYFADRNFNILGTASTQLPGGLVVVDDVKAGDVESGVDVFECKIAYDGDSRQTLEDCTEVGNFILRKHDDEEELYTIIDAEIDRKKQTVYIYAEDAGLDLINEIVGEYEADKEYPIDHYFTKFAYDCGFSIGINEAQGLTRKLTFDNEETVTARLAKVAAAFDNCEIAYSFIIEGLRCVGKVINIYKKRGQDLGVTLRLNKEIDNIIIKKTISNVATALRATGATPDDKDKPITLRGYVYDDGDFYVDGDALKSREALKRWSRYINPDEPNQQDGHEGHIVRLFDYDTVDQDRLCAETLKELKRVRDAEANYEAEILSLPPNVKIGDRVNIVDEAGELYLSSRLLQLERSVVNDEHKAILGEHFIKGKGVSQKVLELAEKHAKTAKSAEKALTIANAAKTQATEAKEQAETAANNAQIAQEKAQEAHEKATQAREAAEQAEEKANNAQSAVDTVEESVAGIVDTVNNAKQAAEQAHEAAEIAQEKAEEAASAAAQAKAVAAEAAAATQLAQGKAETAIEKAEEAKQSAETAITEADNAKATADAAKLDAEKAEQDIASLGEQLETVSRTMEAEYARKTDLTEATASLQTQISQNAAGITSTAKRVQEIDETANNAQEQLAGALAWAEEAQRRADEAKAEAEATQAAAEQAALAASAAQNEADTARAAADTARSVADKAEADLKAAAKDLEEIQSRADATEAEIAAAQQAVEDARAAATSAKADADEAAEMAAEAQAVADNAVKEAEYASELAEQAANNAAAAQALADQASGDAAEAQERAEEAARIAEAAQSVADEARANAESAQATANQAAEEAEAAQKTASNAEAKVAEAAADLAAAQQALADAMADVNATAEQVAAAQAAVEAAQAFADEAEAEAAVAYAAADAARANAEAAQQMAETAKAAADEAQAAAYEAWEAYDEAKTAVDGLANRTAEAVTQIRQNADQIQLRATKEEVTKTLGGYYTKEQTEALVKIEADSIKSTVKREAVLYTVVSGQLSHLITVENAIANSINNLKIYGKTTQGATPTLTAPAALQSTVNDETVSIVIDNKSVTGIPVQNGFPGILMQDTCTNHNFTDANGKKWLTDEIDLARGVYIQRCFVLVFDGSENWVTTSTGLPQIGSVQIPALADIDQDATGNQCYHVCSHVLSVPRSKRTANTVNSYSGANGKTLQFLCYDYENNLDGWKAYLSAQAAAGTPMTMVLGRTTPIEIPLEEIRIPGNPAGRFTIYSEGALYAEISGIASGASVQNAQEAAEGAQVSADSAVNTATMAMTHIQQLADMISTLVTDGNGSSLMTQTADGGWTFSMAAIQEALESGAINLEQLAEALAAANGDIEKLSESLGLVSDYVKITTWNNQPCVELGETDNEFKLRITNTEIQFVDGTTIPTYVTNKKLMIEQAEVKGELQVGGFVWKARSNGNMGLIWKGVDE